MSDVSVRNLLILAALRERTLILRALDAIIIDTELFSITNAEEFNAERAFGALLSLRAFRDTLLALPITPPPSLPPHLPDETEI